MDLAITVREGTPADAEFVRGLTGRLAEAGSPPAREERALLGFHHSSTDQALTALTASAAGTSDAPDAQPHEHPEAVVLIAQTTDGTSLGALHATTTTSALTGERQGYVSTLAVTARAEGRGAGRALMRAAEAWAAGRGYRLLTLEVFASNERARRFYQRLGFEEETLSLVKDLTQTTRPTTRP